MQSQELYSLKSCTILQRAVLCRATSFPILPTSCIIYDMCIMTSCTHYLRQSCTILLGVETYKLYNLTSYGVGQWDVLMDQMRLTLVHDFVNEFFCDIVCLFQVRIVSVRFSGTYKLSAFPCASKITQVMLNHIDQHDHQRQYINTA